MSESDDIDEGGLHGTAFSPRKASKLAIVGAGAVGSTMAYAALMRGSARTDAA